MMHDKDNFKIKLNTLEILCSFRKSDFETHLKLSSLLSVRYFITSHVKDISKLSFRLWLEYFVRRSSKRLSFLYLNKHISRSPLPSKSP